MIVGLLVVLAVLIRAGHRRSSSTAPAAPIATPPAPAPEYTGPSAFIRRHYHGDYSLARSYWVNTFLLSLFAPALGFLLLPWLSGHFPARYGSAGFLILTTAGVLVWFWAIKGTWASASKHVHRGGARGWALAAKLVLVLAVARAIADVGVLMPAVREHASVAMGAQPGPATRLEFRSDGRSIVLSGGINDGTAAQLEDAVRGASAVTTVVLSSQGGWIREGAMLGEVIRRRGLDTYVENSCASACTIALLAGKERGADPSAKIGFHTSRGIGSSEAAPSLQDAAQLKSIYQRAGLSEGFVQQVIGIPHDKIWHPSHAELLAAGVLTR